MKVNEVLLYTIIIFYFYSFVAVSCSSKAGIQTSDIISVICSPDVMEMQTEKTFRSLFCSCVCFLWFNIVSGTFQLKHSKI